MLNPFPVVTQYFLPLVSLHSLHQIFKPVSGTRQIAQLLNENIHIRLMIAFLLFL